MVFKKVSQGIKLIITLNTLQTVVFINVITIFNVDNN